MQLNLFDDNQPETEKKDGPARKTKQEISRERRYQAKKDESIRLQKQWEHMQPHMRKCSDEARVRFAELNAAAPLNIVLVACVSLKSDTAKKAQELYLSDWFKKARAYAEANGDEWYILSARYGLVDPESIIEPYNESLNRKRRADRESWAERVASSLRRRIPPGSQITILAGINYRRELIPLLENTYRLIFPLQHLGIGRQLAYLKNAIK